MNESRQIMDTHSQTFTMQSVLESNQINVRFPGWRSIEIFGAPGAGKSFFCRQLIKQQNIITTADNIATRHFIDSRMGPLTHFLAKVAGSRLMQTYYKIRANRMSRHYWFLNDANLNRYAETVRRAIDRAKLRRGSQKNVWKSVQNTGLAIGLSYASQQKILVDEGLVRKLVTMLVQSDANDKLSEQLDGLRECLHKYPWEKKAIFVDAPVSISSRRQEMRGHVVHGPGKTQSDQQAAAEQVWALCRETGWQIVRICNKRNLPITSGNEDF
jgi:hypothetical protein